MGNKGKRPIADSPKWEGDLWLIEFPNQENPGEWYVFSISTDEESHNRTLKRLDENGFGNYRAYRQDK